MTVNVDGPPPLRGRWFGGWYLPPWWRWIAEIGLVVGVYSAYTLARNSVGSAIVSTEHAVDNALHLISLERALGIFTEAGIQDWAFSHEWLIRAANFYYRGPHFWVTIGVLVFVLLRAPRRYPLARNVLLCTTVLALVGFVVFPLAPPRLLPESFGFVDTARVGSEFWNVDSAHAAWSSWSNQFAAMPSLHIGWSIWCLWAVWPVVGRLGRTLVGAHLAWNVMVVVLTANHYWLDAAGGALVLLGGLALGSVITQRVSNLYARWPSHLDREEISGIPSIVEPDHSLV